MNVSTTKCDKNLEFIFKKIGKLEATLNALIAHLGLEMQVKDEPKGK